MEGEWERFLTYITWPKKNTISALLLAICGFQYCGPSDEVVCSTCNTHLNHWSATDNPYERHKRSAPDCAFLKRNVEHHRDLTEVIAVRPTSEIPIRDLLAATEIHLGDEWNRTLSFSSFPRKNTISVLRLALCGLYYTGADDEVVCSSCDVHLKQWTAEDNPLERHKRNVPDCPFLKTNVGLHRDMTDLRPRTEGPFHHFLVEPGEARVNAYLDEPTAQAVLSMGFPKEQVEMVIERRLSTEGNHFPNVESLLEALLKLEEAGTPATPSATSRPSQNADAQLPNARSGEVAAANSNETPAENVAARLKVTLSLRSSVVCEDITPHHLVLVGLCNRLVAHNLYEDSCARTGMQQRHDIFMQCKKCRYFIERYVFDPCGHRTCLTCFKDIRDHYNNICPFCETVVQYPVQLKFD